ncbi:hypothetical protein [uncultured Ferrimonas sp.]|uniref:hypothetical protein n=1 Tax=uncultured Ferrimonas sp. TaxID=432640 RepID=UPI002634CABB|nr:hypothetical protein [uncultured Ferrimonas sp.]
MSVINDTLKQLERRGGQGAMPASFGADQVVQPPSPPRRKVWWGLLLLPLLLWLWWPTISAQLQLLQPRANSVAPAAAEQAVPAAQTVETVTAAETAPEPTPTQIAVAAEPVSQTAVNAEPQTELKAAVNTVANTKTNTKLKTQAEVDADVDAGAGAGVSVASEAQPKPAAASQPAAVAVPATAVALPTPVRAQPNLQVKPSALSPQELAQQLWQQAQQQTDPRASLEQALTLDPSLHQARLALLPLLPAAAAERLLQQGLAQFPQYAGYAIVSAERAHASGDPQLAIQWLQFSQSLHTETADLPARALLAQQLQQYPLAAQDWQQLVQAEPSNPNWWLSLAYNLEFLERGEHASNAYKQALLLPGLDAAASAYAQQRVQQLGGAK